MPAYEVTPETVAKKKKIALRSQQVLDSEQAGDASTASQFGKLLTGGGMFEDVAKRASEGLGVMGRTIANKGLAGAIEGAAKLGETGLDVALHGKNAQALTGVPATPVVSPVVAAGGVVVPKPGVVATPPAQGIRSAYPEPSQAERDQLGQIRAESEAGTLKGKLFPGQYYIKAGGQEGTNLMENAHMNEAGSGPDAGRRTDPLSMAKPSILRDQVVSMGNAGGTQAVGTSAKAQQTANLQRRLQEARTMEGKQRVLQGIESAQQQQGERQLEHTERMAQTDAVKAAQSNKLRADVLDNEMKTLANLAKLDNPTDEQKALMADTQAKINQLQGELGMTTGQPAQAAQEKPGFIKNTLGRIGQAMGLSRPEQAESVATPPTLDQSAMANAPVGHIIVHPQTGKKLRKTSSGWVQV